jgi:GTP 3',8-cyclase
MNENLAQRTNLRRLPVVSSTARSAREEQSEIRVLSAHPVAKPRSVRISITDRCDFACTYCRPSRNDGYAETRLSLEAWRTTIDALVVAGVRRVRITGGEPLIHPHVLEIVRMIAARGVEDLALTTNASQLMRLARPLREAGLSRINVSIDSLDEARFAAITRGGKLAPVLEGIEAAISAGFAPIKLNAVVLRGVNDDELEPLLRWAWDRGLVPRFLEVMPIAEGAKLAREHLVPVTEMRSRLAHLLTGEEPTIEPDRGPARYVAARHDPALRVGFISGTSDTYCASCDRLRVSSSGVLRPCLATDDGVDAREAAERGELERMPELLAEAWAKKPDGRSFKGCTEPSAAELSMRAIGG